MSGAVMFQGTGSDVGKSILVAGLCRHFARQGLQVRPFKPQNMSNNAAVAADGGEIGRAQWLQARAAGIDPSHHMNPVLLKPEASTGAQVVLQGRVRTRVTASGYGDLKPKLLPAVMDSYRRLRQEADLVLVEGAGSPAEVNLRRNDIANMGFAEAANVPVFLIGDIDRGGVLAAIVGTMQLLEQHERQRVKGYIVNKFRGDVSLFGNAPEIIQRHCGLKSAGIVPWFTEADRLPAEDSLSLPRTRSGTGARLRVVALQLPRMANADDLDPLRQAEDVDFQIIQPGTPIPAAADLVVLTGSKATLADLSVLKDAGWDIDMAAHVRRGGYVIGLCGGYQMLGRKLSDPGGVEGPPQTADGIGLLDVETVMASEKQVATVNGHAVAEGVPVAGYEIHIGGTAGADCTRPMLRLSREGGDADEGARSANGRVMGSYVHGLFGNDEFRRAFLSRLLNAETAAGHYWQTVDRTLDALADHLARSLDIDRILSVSRCG